MGLLRSSADQVRHAARSLGRRPGLSLLAVVTLGLGIGATTAIFSVVNVVLLRPLPFEDPERLVAIWSTAPSQGLSEGFASYPDFHDWREQSTLLADLAAFWTFPNGDVNLTGGAEAERVAVARITAGFFETLGVPPLHGRSFQPEESVVGNHRRAILSHGLWQRQFGADPTLIGQSVMVNGFPYTVVGIMPSQLQSQSVRALGTDVDLWRPLVPDDNQTGGRDGRKLRIVGRLAPGVTLAQAESELARIASRLATAYPDTNRDRGIRLVPLREQVVGDVWRGLVFLMAAVAVVLLAACVNVANLLLIKAATTRKQVAVQHALGASRLRLSTQALAESLVLGGAGAALGLALAYGSIRVFVALGPDDVPLLADARVDGSVLIFAVVASLVTVVLVGLIPAWRRARPDAMTVLRQGGGRSRGGDDRRLMGGLTVAQVALAMVLLTTGGLLVRSFQALLRVDPGLDPKRVLTLQLELPMASTYPTQAGRDAFFANLLDRIGGLPGVSAVSLASGPPIDEQPSAFAFTRPGAADDRVFETNWRMVAPSYFSLLRIPLVRGRAFTASDGRTAPRVVIVSETLARDVWGAGNPIGDRIDQPLGGEAEVVGVAGDVRVGGLDGAPGRTVYLPALQWAYNFMTVIVKSRHDPRTGLPAVQGLVRELDPDLPLHYVRTIEELVARSVAPQRFQMALISTFSLLVLVLALIGTYGVAAYGVAERTGELGIRMALGATAADIRRLVLREGALLALIGIVVGGAAATALSGVLSRFVYQISPRDLVTFTVTPLLLASTALIAVLVPAIRATRVDPMGALRVD